MCFVKMTRWTLHSTFQNILTAIRTELWKKNILKADNSGGMLERNFYTHPCKEKDPMDFEGKIDMWKAYRRTEDLRQAMTKVHIALLSSELNIYTSRRTLMILVCIYFRDLSWCCGKFVVFQLFLSFVEGFCGWHYGSEIKDQLNQYSVDRSTR